LRAVAGEEIGDGDDAKGAAKRGEEERQKRERAR